MGTLTIEKEGSGGPHALPWFNGSREYLPRSFLTLDTLTLRTVCNELGEVQHKAFEIGIQLGISRSKMLQFKQEGDLLSAAVDYWLCGNIKEVPIAWRSVVEALLSNYVGEAARADAICAKYCRQPEDDKGQKIEGLATL